MPPEVCLGKPYDHKADVWAVGVILYEMIMLKKPFESDSINGVLSMITSCAYEPLSKDVDPNLKMLVVALLNKDFNKRPSIIEVANVPCVRKEILDFIEENDILQEVLEIIDLIKQDDNAEEE
jgi:serine/threonine protein kinase